jgi:long-subunit acyl-CoA synthetase (AMP-forming)
LNNSKATNQFFKDGFFYPGDLGMLTDENHFKLLRRVDNLINLSGVKVNPESIEGFLNY